MLISIDAKKAFNSSPILDLNKKPLGIGRYFLYDKNSKYATHINTVCAHFHMSVLINQLEEDQCLSQKRKKRKKFSGQRTWPGVSCKWFINIKTVQTLE